MRTDDTQVKILLNLLEHERLGFNELYKKVVEKQSPPRYSMKVSKDKFMRRLFSLITEWNPPLVRRDPPFTEKRHRGKKHWFYLTKAGKSKAMVEGVLTATEVELKSNILKRFLDEAIEHGQKGAFNSATMIVKSKSLPILGFLCLLSRKQYLELTKKLELEENRDEISGILPKFIDFYASSQDQFYAEHLPQKESVFFFGNFPEKISLQMKEAVELGVFQNYTHILKQVITVVNQWSNLWEEFKQGKKPIIFPSGKKFKYDAKEQKVIETTVH